MIEYGYLALAIMDSSTRLIHIWWIYTLKGAWC